MVMSKPCRVRVLTNVSSRLSVMATQRPPSLCEASATSGFGFGILKAVEQGIVPESYRANAMRALQPVLDCIDEKGVVQQVSYGTPMGRESKDFYKQIPLHPMPYGQAMAILFLMEAEAQV